MKEDIQILDKKINIFNERYQKYKEQNSIDEVEFKEILCDVLSWMEICIKRVENLNRIEAGKKSAIKYANNIKKHSVSIYTYNLNSYAKYPSNNLYPSPNVYPSDFNIWWNTLPLDDSQFTNQYKNYNKYLKGKEIYNSINEIYTIIKKHYKNN